MKLKIPVVLLSVLALASPAATFAKGNGKAKGKHHAQVERTTGSRTTPTANRGRRPVPGEGKITICHVPPGNTANRQTITVDAAAWNDHLGHGDYRGACH